MTGVLQYNDAADTKLERCCLHGVGLRGVYSTSNFILNCHLICDRSADWLNNISVPNATLLIVSKNMTHNVIVRIYFFHKHIFLVSTGDGVNYRETGCHTLWNIFKMQITIFHNPVRRMSYRNWFMIYLFFSSIWSLSNQCQRSVRHLRFSWLTKINSRQTQ